jgi:hypothetical protein
LSIKNGSCNISRTIAEEGADDDDLDCWSHNGLNPEEQPVEQRAILASCDLLKKTEADDVPARRRVG